VTNYMAKSQIHVNHNVLKIELNIEMTRPLSQVNGFELLELRRNWDQTVVKSGSRFSRLNRMVWF